MAFTLYVMPTNRVKRPPLAAVTPEQEQLRISEACDDIARLIREHGLQTVQRWLSDLSADIGGRAS